MIAFQAKESLSGANGSNTDAAAVAFLAGAKREAPREYAPYPGLHTLPPTPSSPFPRANTPFNPACKLTVLFPSFKLLPLNNNCDQLFTFI